MLTKSQKLVVNVWIWSIAVLTALVLFQSVSYEFFIVLFLIGLFIISGLTGPFHAQPFWKLKLNFALVIGMLLFIAIVLEKALSILNQ
jgi:hypothetical protein